MDLSRIKMLNKHYLRELKKNINDKDLITLSKLNKKFSEEKINLNNYYEWSKVSRFLDKPTHYNNIYNIKKIIIKKKKDIDEIIEKNILIVEILFDDKFNDIIYHWPCGIKKIKFGYYYNKSIPQKSLPQTLEKIKFLGGFNSSITEELFETESSLKSITFGYNYTQSVKNLPKNLKILNMKKCIFYVEKLDILPESLEYLILDRYYNKPLAYLPSSLKTIILPNRYKYFDSIPKNIKIKTYNFFLINGLNYPLKN